MILLLGGPAPATGGTSLLLLLGHAAPTGGAPHLVGGAAVGTVTVGGALTPSRRFSGAAVVTGIAGGTLTPSRLFSGAAIGTVTVIGALGTSRLFSGDADPTVTVEGALTPTRFFAGAVESAVTIEAIFTPGGPAAELDGLAGATITLVGTLATVSSYGFGPTLPTQTGRVDGPRTTTRQSPRRTVVLV